MSPKIFRGRIGEDEDDTCAPSFAERSKSLPIQSKVPEVKPVQGQAAVLTGLVVEMAKLAYTRNGDPMQIVVLDVSTSKFKSDLRKCVAFGETAARISETCSITSRLTVEGRWRISANNTASKRWMLTIRTAQCPDSAVRPAAPQLPPDQTAEAILWQGEQDRQTPIAKRDLNKLLRAFGEREMR